MGLCRVSDYGDHLHAGFPAPEAPECLILDRGTADPLATAAGGRRQASLASAARPGEQDLIRGELVTYTNR